MKSYSTKELAKMLRDDGWILKRTVGAHSQWKHTDRPGTVTLQSGQRDIRIANVRSIFRQAGWKWPPE